MKRIIKKLILAFIIICPFFVSAAGLNYDDAVYYTNNYLYKFQKYNNSNKKTYSSK